MILVLKTAALEDTDDRVKDFGRIGKKFEDAFLRAAKLLGLQFEEVKASKALYDLRTKGRGWSRVIGGNRVNLKVYNTRWMFASSKLSKMLPWTVEEMDKRPDFDWDEEAERVRRFLTQRGLQTIKWTRPKNTTIVLDIIEAADAEDLPTLRKLMVRKNFETFDLRGFTVRLTRRQEANGVRVGSIAIELGGKVVARSEKPRMVSRSMLTVFKSTRADRITHRIKSRESA